MKKKMTASELMAQLNADPEFVAGREVQEKLRREREEEFRNAEAPIVRDLRVAGIKVDAVSQVTRETPGFMKALPILLRHLQRSSYPGTVREGIARTLAVPEAKFAWKTLVEQYRNERERAPKSGLAVALAAIAASETIADVISIFRDHRNGSSRVLLVDALARSSDPRARAALLELREDPDVAKEIVRVLHGQSERQTAARRGRRGGGPPSSGHQSLAETSMSFDWADVRPFLEAVTKLVRGFDEQNIESVVCGLDMLDVDNEDAFGFEVRLSGNKVPLEIRGLKADTNAVDLYFRSSPALVEKIRELYSNFVDERGL